MTSRAHAETEELAGLVENLETRLVLVEAALAEQSPPTFRGAASIASIVVDAAALFEIPAHDILSDRRSKAIAHARFAVAWVARQVTSYSLPRIAGALRRADHSTIIHAIRRAEQLRRSDPDFEDISDRLLAAAEARSPK